MSPEFATSGRTDILRTSYDQSIRLGNRSQVLTPKDFGRSGCYSDEFSLNLEIDGLVGILAAVIMNDWSALAW